MSNESGRKPVLHKKHVARLQREQQQTRVVLYTFFGVLVIVLLLLLYGWLDIKFFQLNKPVAKVGDTEILLKDFEPRVKLQRQNLLSQYNQYEQYAQFFGMDVSSQLQQIQAQLDAPEQVGQTVLDFMINEELIRQEAAKRGITISEQEIDEAVRAGYEFYPDGTPTPTVTPTEVTQLDNPPEALALVTATPAATSTPRSTATPDPNATATLAPTATATFEPTFTPTAGPSAPPLPTSTPYTAEGFQKLLDETDQNLSKYGFSKEYYRRFYTYQLLREKLQAAIVADVPATEDQVWARHILVADEVTALDIIKRVQAGEDFAQLALELSTDEGSAIKGGDLGWFGKGQMVAEFETAAFALEKSGDITTTPVQSQFGYHIIQLIAKQSRPLNADAYQTAKDNAFQDWLDAAREEYGVETYDIWQQRVPTEPNFISIATEAVIQQQTAQAESVATIDAAKTTTP